MITIKKIDNELEYTVDRELMDEKEEALALLGALEKKYPIDKVLRVFIRMHMESGDKDDQLREVMKHVTEIYNLL